MAVLLAGCGEPPVLEVGRIGYSESELAALADDHVRDLVNLTAFGQAVSDRRLHEVVDPFARRDLRSIVLQRAALEIGAADVGLDTFDLEAAYREDPAFELTVRHLVILSERWRPQAHRDSAEARAAEAARRARDGEPFDDLVAEYSEEPGAAERGGLLEPGREGSWVPDFWAAARALDRGEVSGVVETEYGFHVLRLEARDTVPFEEVRGQVLERSLDLGEAFAASARWLEERGRAAVVDTAAILEWTEAADPGQLLVEWPGTETAPFLAGDLAAYVLTLPPGQARPFLGAPPDERIRLVESVARNRLLLERAAALGIEATGPQRSAVEQRWREQAEHWAGALGFRPGVSDRGVKEQAQAAAAAHGQEVLQARSEVARLSRVLRALYPVVEHPAPS